RTFRSSKGPIPRPYDYPSHRVFDTQEDLVSSCLDMYANDYESAKEQASVRDGFRCMVSKYFDASSFHHSPYPKRTVLVSKGTMASTQYCHIMSEASAEDNNLYDPAQRQRHATSGLTIVSSLGLTDLVSNFYAGGTTHDLSSILILWRELYQSFDGLEF
ncbi:uncharacterized protein PHACADRAFT_105685, partial [Phanerochaete carnosa HHB-10118-sp]